MRERELSIRQAIGATRRQLIQYLLSETIIMAGLGAILASLVLFNLPALRSLLTDGPLPLSCSTWLICAHNYDEVSRNWTAAH